MENETIKKDLEQSTRKYNKVSNVLGVISIVLVFVFTIFIFPLAILGFIFGIKYKINNKRSFGATLSLISMIIAIPLLIVYSTIFYKVFDFKNWNKVSASTWNCSTRANGSYAVRFEIDREGNFVWSKYDDQENSYVTGKIESEFLPDDNSNQNYLFYQITLNGERFVIDGELQDTIYKSIYNMGVGMIFTDAKGKAVLRNLQTDNIYYCDREK